MIRPDLVDSGLQASHSNFRAKPMTHVRLRLTTYGSLERPCQLFQHTLPLLRNSNAFTVVWLSFSIDIWRSATMHVLLEGCVCLCFQSD